MNHLTLACSAFVGSGAPLCRPQKIYRMIMLEYVNFMNFYFI